jgi:nucleoside-diphosphate-sugar epimerase
MKIFVAGATYAVGLPLVRALGTLGHALCTLGHQVTGMTRAGPGVDRLRELGAPRSPPPTYSIRRRFAMRSRRRRRTRRSTS